MGKRRERMQLTRDRGLSRCDLGSAGGDIHVLTLIPPRHLHSLTMRLGLWHATFDLTADVVLMASLNMAMTLALVIFIICCTSVISFEQSRLLAGPLTEISRAVMDAGGAIFAGATQTRRSMIDPDFDGAIVFDVSTVRRTLKRIAQIFNTKSQKVTMVYTPDDVVWTFNVKQQKEVATATHQTSHRLNKDGLLLLKKKTPKGMPDPKMEMRRNFIFQVMPHEGWKRTDQFDSQLRFSTRPDPMRAHTQTHAHTRSGATRPVRTSCTIRWRPAISTSTWKRHPTTDASCSTFMRRCSTSTRTASSYKTPR